MPWRFLRSEAHVTRKGSSGAGLDLTKHGKRAAWWWRSTG
jgi:hypothetical protein